MRFLQTRATLSRQESEILSTISTSTSSDNESSVVVVVVGRRGDDSIVGVVMGKGDGYEGVVMNGWVMLEGEGDGGGGLEAGCGDVTEIRTGQLPPAGRLRYPEVE